MRRGRGPLRSGRSRIRAIGAPAGGVFVALVMLLSPIALARLALVEHSARTSAATSSGSRVTMHGAPAWGAYHETSVQKGSDFTFRMVLNTILPVRPFLFNDTLIYWNFAIDTNPAANATGWPAALNSSGGPNSAEYLVQLWWNGGHFVASVANRTALRTGGNATRP